MITTDEWLQQLLARICGNPEPNTWEQRRAMNRLLIALQHLPGLLKSSHLDYLEALDKTWEWVSRNICAFEPHPHEPMQTTLIRWINSHLYWRIRDLSQPEVSGQYRLDKVIDKSGENYATLLDNLSETNLDIPVLSGIDSYIEKLQHQEIQQIYLELEHYIQEDTQGSLRSCHPRKHPDCNCRFLSKRLLLKDPPDKLADISRELGINYKTLKSHWENKCKPLLQDIAVTLGYHRV
jgi:hypothetical protein